jgi:hypothetical protein
MDAPIKNAPLMDYDRLKLAALKVCRLRGQDPHEEIDVVERGEYQGKAPRWTIAARELQVLEPLLHGIMFAYEPREGE